VTQALSWVIVRAGFNKFDTDTCLREAEKTIKRTSSCDVFTQIRDAFFKVCILSKVLQVDTPNISIYWYLYIKFGAWKGNLIDDFFSYGISSCLSQKRRDPSIPCRTGTTQSMVVGKCLQFQICLELEILRLENPEWWCMTSSKLVFPSIWA